MLGFNRIILSRKGFDSSAGGGFSPFDLDTGKYIVLPIPENKKDRDISTPKYEDIKIESRYFEGCDASNLKELMWAYHYRWPPIIKRNKSEESDYAHFDPWLGSCPWLSEDSDHHKGIGAFGQVDRAQTILCKNGVGEGSLFLFFSRFKPINWTKASRFNDIDISTEHLKEGVYFIYGWFKVGEVIDKFEKIDNSDLLSQGEKTKLKEHHPHATQKYFGECRDKNNTIYIADKLLFPYDTVGGCGYFDRLSENLLLTATDSAQEHCKVNWIPSRWKMKPGFSFETCKSNFTERKHWYDTDRDGSYLVKTGWRWQEAVFEESEEFCQWFNDKLLPEMRK